MTYSPDGRYWWNGYRWGPVPRKTLWDRMVGSPWWAWIAAFVLLNGVLIVGNVLAFAAMGSIPLYGEEDPAGPCSPAPCANVNGTGWRNVPLSGFGWIVKVSNVKYDPAAGSPFPAANPGYVYVTADVTFLNTTKSGQTADPHDFSLQDGARFLSDVSFVVRGGAGSAPLPSSTVKPENVNPAARLGPETLVFQATSGKPAPLMLFWRPGRYFAPSYRIPLT